jgi:molybdopterin-guanine dinucleotide biosynthesis protein A
MQPTATAGAIIAGGRARRFGGRDKSRLVVEGRPIIVRQVDILQRVAATLFVVAPDASRFADLGLPVYADRIGGAGALGGIYTALEAAREDYVLTVASDLPFLDAGLLTRLTELARGGDGAWIRTPHGAEPLLACYRRSARHAIRTEIDQGRLKAADLSMVLRIVEMDLREVERFGPPERLLANINTPDDYARVKNGELRMEN